MSRKNTTNVIILQQLIGNANQQRSSNIGKTQARLLAFCLLYFDNIHWAECRFSHIKLNDILITKK